MLNLNTIDESISKHYDCEMSESELFSHEARMANSCYVSEYAKQKYFDFYKISNSINKVKKSNEKYSALLVDEIINKNKDKLFFNLYSVIFKCFNKKFSCLPLNILRNNSK